MVTSSFRLETKGEGPMALMTCSKKVGVALGWTSVWPAVLCPRSSRDRVSDMCEARRLVVLMG